MLFPEGLIPAGYCDYLTRQANLTLEAVSYSDNRPMLQVGGWGRAELADSRELQNHGECGVLELNF